MPSSTSSRAPPPDAASPPAIDRLNGIGPKAWAERRERVAGRDVAVPGLLRGRGGPRRRPGRLPPRSLSTRFLGRPRGRTPWVVARVEPVVPDGGSRRRASRRAARTGSCAPRAGRARSASEREVEQEGSEIAYGSSTARKLCGSTSVAPRPGGLLQPRGPRPPGRGRTRATTSPPRSPTSRRRLRGEHAHVGHRLRDGVAGIRGDSDLGDAARVVAVEPESGCGGDRRAGGGLGLVLERLVPCSAPAPRRSAAAPARLEACKPGSAEGCRRPRRHARPPRRAPRRRRGSSSHSPRPSRTTRSVTLSSLIRVSWCTADAALSEPGALDVNRGVGLVALRRLHGALRELERPSPRANAHLDVAEACRRRSV